MERNGSIRSRDRRFLLPVPVPAGVSGHGFVWFEFTFVVAGVVGLLAGDLTFVEQIA